MLSRKSIRLLSEIQKDAEKSNLPFLSNTKPQNVKRQTKVHTDNVKENNFDHIPVVYIEKELGISSDKEAEKKTKIHKFDSSKQDLGNKNENYYENLDKYTIKVNEKMLNNAYTIDNVDAYLKEEKLFPTDLPFTFRKYVTVINNYLLQFSKSTHFRFIPSEEQLRVLYSYSNRLLIESGAGTGKTTIIIIKMFLEQNLFRLNEDDILAITYTREGASSMNLQYQKIMNEYKSNRFLEFRTIHAYCLNLCSAFINDMDIITEYKDAITYEWDDYEDNYIEKKIKLYDIINEGINMLGIPNSPTPKNTYNVINTIVEMCIDNEEQYRNIESLTDFPLNYSQIISVYNYCLKRKSELGVLDYSDMLIKSREILLDIIDGKIIPNEKQIKTYTFKSIYIDEVQDISPLQTKIVHLLLKLNPKVRLTVIGDTDQSIYSFRGASIDFILNFPQIFKDNRDTELIYLTRNRRSAENIIKFSDKFIRNNHNRFPKILRGLIDGEFDRKRLGDIKIYEDAVGTKHRNMIKEKILETSKNRMADLRKIAILYREHKQASWLLNFLVTNKIPYNINLEPWSEEYIINAKEFKDLIFLTLLLRQPNNADLIKLYLWKLVPNITKTIAEQIGFAMKENPHNKLLGFVKKFGTAEDINDIIKLRKDLLEPNTTPAAFFKELLARYKRSYYTNYINNQHKIDRSDDIIDYFESKEDLLNIQSQVEGDKIWIKSNSNNKASITLNTFHVSKGLEYDDVYILPLSDAVSPKISKILRNMNIKGITNYIEEERRLLYVAITRAKNNLYVYYTPNEKSNLPSINVDIKGKNDNQEKVNLNRKLTTSKGLFATELLQAYEELKQEGMILDEDSNN